MFTRVPTEDDHPLVGRPHTTRVSRLLGRLTFVALGRDTISITPFKFTVNNRVSTYVMFRFHMNVATGAIAHDFYRTDKNDGLRFDVSPNIMRAMVDHLLEMVQELRNSDPSLIKEGNEYDSRPPSGRLGKG